MSLLGVFKTIPRRAVMLVLSLIGFHGLIVANKVKSFSELVVCSGMTLSDNLVVVDMILS